jgi:hypothetical protein
MEKRRFTRVPFKARVTVTSDKATVEGETDDLSLKGMHFQACQLFAIDEQVEVRISLPDSVPPKVLKTRAVVVRYQDGGTGFEFAQMDFDSFFALQDLIAHASGTPGLVMTEALRFFNED